MSDREKILFKQLSAYKRKYFLNLFLKGLIISTAVLLGMFLVFNYLEYTFQFGINIRTFLFFSFVITSLYLLGRLVIIPAYKIANINKAMDNEIAARQIGNYFPEIKDKLLNIIQLRNKSGDSYFVTAGINQKMEGLPSISYEQAVELKTNNRFLPWLLVPLALIAGIILFNPQMILTSTSRITQFNKDFIPQAPFDFNFLNESNKAFKNEDFTINLKIEGSSLPENVYINNDGRKFKMASVSNDLFTYTFNKIQNTKSIQFEASGFLSQTFKVNVFQRPDLRNFNLYFEYPKYLNKKTERISNIGNAIVPEGTSIKWQLNTLEANHAFIQFDSKSSEEIPMELSDNQIFEYNKIMKSSDKYQLKLSNDHSLNKDPIIYNIDVIKDEYPKIISEVYPDTTLYSQISFAGNVLDDYGLTQLKLFYSFDNENYESLNIPILSGQTSQRYFYNWVLDSLMNDTGKLSYYLQVWDNDGVNGRKSTKTATYKFELPNKKEIKDNIDKVAQQTESKIDKTLQDAEELKEQLEEAEKRIKGKKELNWQDDKQIKDLLKKREALNEAIEELKEQNRNNSIKREKFSQQDEKIKERVQKLQELMDELLDDETKKLYEELKQLLEQNQDVEDIQELLDKINNKETNLEQELERTLELFKRMKFEFELNEALNELKEQITDQERLMRETEKQKGEGTEKSSTLEEQEEKNQYKEDDLKSKDSNSLKEKQEQLQEEFKELQEDLEELNEHNQSLKNPESLPDTQEEQESVEENQQQSKENLENNQKQKSKESQKKARDAMKQMEQKLSQMQSSMEMDAMQENLDDLRAIVYNLLRLSFEQENLMNEFTGVKQSDPRFIELSQKQLKLKDDSQIVQDSLLALANRVFQIASFVTREVTSMNEHMDKSVEAIKERKKPIAVSEQQFAMTSINNLALLLDDVLQQMQSAMADAMGKPQKKKGNQKTPSLSELQQQLNGKIEELKESGKSGRQLSEELAKLAAEQERIRQALKEAQDKAGQGENGKMPGQGLPEKMEETESDLVNKRLTTETILRQKEILTRLLEAEDALRERDLDEERKAETAKDYEKAVPRAFEEYFKLKEQEIELLKTIPPKLYPYYKNEINEYFRRIGELNNTQSK